MDNEQLISFAESVCGHGQYNEIIPYLKYERANNNNIAEDKTFNDSIEICKIRQFIYESAVND